MSEPLLDVRDLSVRFGETRVLDRVNLTVQPGEIVGIVGESGSGKSTLVQAILRTLPPPGVIHNGSVRLAGKEVLDLDDNAVRSLRWKQASMVPQSALDALNPVLTVRSQMVDTLLAHETMTIDEADRQALSLLDRVGIDKQWYYRYPHQLSGGMRQRVALAIALLCSPPLVFLDEPTTALDVIVEARILSELLGLREEQGFAMVFVTHDLPLLMTFATRIAVMYAGRLCEVGPLSAFESGGRHPYTQALLASVPHVDGPWQEATSIPGSPPALSQPPTGCRFHPRCAHAMDACKQTTPSMTSLTADHRMACLLETS